MVVGMRPDFVSYFGFDSTSLLKGSVRGILGLVWLGVSLGAVSPATAQSQSNAGSTSGYYGLFPDVNAASPQAVSFSTDTRSLRFVLDRSQPRFVLLRFEGDDEIWALSSHWGPRGDEFLRNDVGEVMVRITSLGGVTMYGPLGNSGGPASRIGKARSLSAPSRSAGTLQLTVERAIGWFSRFGHRSIRVEAAGGLAPSLVYEALQRTAQGMSLAPRGFFGQPQRRVKLVRVERAQARPTVTWDRGILVVGVVPGAGYAGRPSSAAVLAALIKQN
jgi:Domain of unknown function (DUF4908)